MICPSSVMPFSYSIPQSKLINEDNLISSSHSFQMITGLVIFVISSIVFTSLKIGIPLHLFVLWSLHVPYITRCLDPNDMY